MASRRDIPSLDRLLERPALRDLARRFGHQAVLTAARRAADAMRVSLPASATPERASSSPDEITDRIERSVLAECSALDATSLRPVINATGVIVHTNLGRAPLADEARDAAGRVACGYSNLEYDLGTGARGQRHVHAERLLTALTGAESAIVVNNNAAAILLVLAALARGREVVVSRGELVEIGGGFRVPEVCEQSGALLREAGTTNRTRASDYAAAITDRTALLLRVHPSNFRIEGFVERPAIEELAALAHRFSIPMVEDLGSGWLGLTDAPPALRDEPSATASLASGTDVITFSGDKLLGGPQAGIIAGRREFVDRIRRHPLMRAVRADKQTYAALEATLALWAQPSMRHRIPVVRMLTMAPESIAARAHRVIGMLADATGIRADAIDGFSTIGGGSAPGSSLPTTLIAVEAAGASAAALEARLRAGDPAVVARIQDDRVVLDLRTVDEAEEETLAQRLRALANP